MHAPERRTFLVSGSCVAGQDRPAMKPNGMGIRLVQRKFAQGVPVPASHAPPAPPERKPEPSKERRTVYHSHMSARNLLDILSLQNVHRHKQPMVLLERLRVNDIPTAPSPILVKKKRLNTKARKNNMALRPREKRAQRLLRKGKKESPHKKRPLPPKKLEEMSSATDDDTPLLYLRKKLPRKPSGLSEPTPSSSKSSSGSTRITKKIGSKKPDKVNKFKRPANASTLRCKQQRLRRDSSLSSSVMSIGPRSIGMLPARLAKRRAAPAPGPEPSTRTLRPRATPDKVKRKRMGQSDPVPRTPTASGQASSETADRVQKVARTPTASGQASSETSNRELKVPRTPTASGQASTVTADWEQKVPRSPTASGHAPSETSYQELKVARTPTASGQASSETSNRELKVSWTLIASGQASPETGDWQEASSPELVTCPSKAFKCVDDVVKADASGSPSLHARCAACRDCGVVAKILQLKHLIRAEGINPAAIYDFHAEIEEAISPSISSFRSRKSVDGSDGEHIYLDILPPETPQILQIICRTTADRQMVSSVRVVDREMASNVVHPSLAEHENLLDQLLVCMTRRAQLTSQSNQEQSKEAESHKKTTKKRRNTGRNTRSREESTTNGSQELATDSEPNEGPVAPPHPVPEVPVSLPSPARPGPPKLLAEGDAHLFKQPAARQRSTASSKFTTPRAAAAAPRQRAIEPRQSAVEPQPSTSAQDNAQSMVEDFGMEDPGPSASAVSSVARLPQTLVDAPVFRPSAAEFTDPIEFYKKIRPFASKYGLCKIVPPAGFAPPCVIGDHIRFAVIYQYISKLYNRWGPLARELAAIKVLLRMQKVACNRAPLLNGCEVSLPKLYHAVERHGGLTKVMHRKRWGRVAEDMKLASCPNPESKLDKIYMRYLLPYATLSDKERQNIMAKVETHWTTNKYKKMLTRARNPLHAQKRLMGESDTSSDEGESDTGGALEEAEDCITQGRLMNLATFRKVAKTFMDSQFPSGRPDTDTVERAYWRAILLGTEHIVANTASIDTGEEGHGFPKDAAAPCGAHPWNLKVLATNPGNVLRFLGSVLGVTVPTLHLSMLFSTCCWHRDPHGLPWVEYLHSGPEKIWYGIPGSQSDNFRRAVETLCPAYCQNKSIWLASDIAMIPPEILTEHGVALARVEQKPGEFVMVFPEAHSCSITTGFSVSESVYFAPNTWFDNVHKLFQELRESCEPTMFSLEKLLLKGAEQAGGAAVRVLASRLQAELWHRRQLEQRGVLVVVSVPSAEEEATWASRGYDECEFCRASLYLSKVTGAAHRRAPLCPEHALKLIQRSRLGGSLELHTTYSNGALQARLARLGGGMWESLQPIPHN